MFVPKAILFKISLQKKEQGEFCCALRCTNKPHERKGGLCNKHYSIKSRISDPVYDRYKNFKNNALRRKKEFTITLEQFRDFCHKTGYIIKKGMRGKNCTIDRIRNWEGYHIDNIQIKSNEANIRKYHDHDKHFTELPECDPDWLLF